MRRIQAIGAADLMASMSLGLTSVAHASLPGPNGAWVTRAEFVVLLDKALFITPVYPATPDFTDVTASSPNYGYIEAACQKGFTNGVSAGIFGPNLPVTRAEVAKWLVLAVGAGSEISKAPPTGFIDNSKIPAVLAPYVSEAVSLGLIQGFLDGTFRPQTYLTTQEDTHLLAHIKSYLTSSLQGSASVLASWGIVPLSSPPSLQAADNPETSAMWADANKGLVITATLKGGSRPFLSLAPGQAVTLVATWNSPDPTAANGGSQPTWTVSSPNASITPRSSGSYYYPGESSPQAINSQPYQFTAQQAGEYVIQAQWDGVQSVPLVITVGLSQLTQASDTVDPAVAGVASLPQTEIATDSPDHSAISQGYGKTIGKLFIGTPLDGWIPVSGVVLQGWTNPSWSQTVTISLYDSTGTKAKDYVLPLAADGSFSGIVASPFTEMVSLVISPSDYTLNLAAPLIQSSSLSWQTEVYVPNAAVLPQNLQASSVIDYNSANRSQALDVAKTLWQNAPDPLSGLAAVSNWVSDLVIYDYPQSTAAVAPWATAGEVYQQRTGVGQDYSDLLAAVYRGIGVPAQVYQGYVSGTWMTSWSGTYKPNHAWVVAKYDGTSFTVDPTWNTHDTSSNYMLTSAFTTETSWFDDTHYSEGPETYNPVE